MTRATPARPAGASATPSPAEARPTTPTPAQLGTRQPDSSVSPVSPLRTVYRQAEGVTDEQAQQALRTVYGIILRAAARAEAQEGGVP
jgi:hypothetical protein